MKKGKFTIVIMWVFFMPFVCVGVMAAENLVKNYSFEDYDGNEFTDWSLSFTSKQNKDNLCADYTIATDAHTGKNALKITMNPLKKTLFIYAQSGIKISPDKKYYAECWIKKEKPGRLIVAIRWEKEKSIVIGNETMAAYLFEKEISEYTKFTFKTEVFPPADTLSATILIKTDWYDTVSTEPSTIFIDDVVLEER